MSDSQPLLFSEDSLRIPASAETMALLKEKALSCRACSLREGCGSVVFGSGKASRPDIMVVGEAPNLGDETEGTPFTGLQGELLDKMLRAIGYTIADVYLANAVNCRTSKNKAPQENEVSTCRPWLITQIRAVQPRVILALGQVSTDSLLGTEAALSRIRGRWGEWEGIPVMPTMSPAYLYTHPEEKLKVWGDLLEILKKLGKPAPSEPGSGS